MSFGQFVLTYASDDLLTFFANACPILAILGVLAFVGLIVLFFCCFISC